MPQSHSTLKESPAGPAQEDGPNESVEELPVKVAGESTFAECSKPGTPI
jgi:hypothetical protein